MTNKSIIINAATINEFDLIALIQALRHSSISAEIHVKNCFEVSSDNEAVLSALDTLFGDGLFPKQPQLEAPKDTQKKHAGGRPRKVAAEALRSNFLLGPGGGEVIDGVTLKTIEAHTPLELKPGPRREILSWRVILPGMPDEQITISEKDRRLNEGLFEPGTMLKHPRAGLLHVLGIKGGPQTTTPQNGSSQSVESDGQL